VARPTHSRPTDGELIILELLWRQGGRTAEQVRRQLAKAGDVTPGSIQNRLQIMIEKGYLQRDESVWPRVYTAKIKEDSAKRSLLNDLIGRVFGGSAKNLVMHTLASRKATSQELAEIRKRLDELEAEK